jgi:hypothetical protein
MGRALRIGFYFAAQLTYAGVALTLGITVLFLLFGEPALETVLGRGSRPQ